MERTRVSACVFAVAASLAGCAATGEVEYAGTVHVTSPELLMVSPGVQVIADADEPLFYSKGYYWLYRDGYWLRSDSYRGGFARVDFVYVPGELRVIDRPQLYVQYRRHMGRDRFARPPETQTRTQPTYPSQSPTYPSQTYPDTTSPNQPAVPGQQPGGITPPAASPMPRTTVTPNDNWREPTPQRSAPPDIDRTNRPDDRGNPNADKDKDRGEREKSDRDDRGTPPSEANKPDKDKDKNKDKGKEKTKKNEKY